MAKKPLTVEQSNFFKLVILVVDESRLILKQWFDYFYDPRSLASDFNDRSTIRPDLNFAGDPDRNNLTLPDILEDLLNNKILNKQQWNLLYPVRTTVTSSSFDLSLLSTLLTSICDAGKCGIDRQIHQLRKVRNEVYGHVLTSSLPTDEFRKIWCNITQLLGHLGERFYGRQYGQELAQRRDQPLTQAYDAAQHISLLQQWTETDQRLTIIEGKFVSIEGDIDELRKTDDNIKEELGDVRKSVEEKLTSQHNMIKRIDSWEEQFTDMAGDHDVLKRKHEEHAKDITQVKEEHKHLQDQHKKLKTKHMKQDINIQGAVSGVQDIKEDIQTVRRGMDSILTSSSESRLASFEQMKELQDSIERVGERVAKLIDEKKTQMASTGDIDRVIRQAQVRRILDVYKEEDTLFVETNGYVRAKVILEDKHCLTISGLSGDGKTSMAIHLMFHLSGSEEGEHNETTLFSPIFVDTPEDWKKFVDVSKKQVVLIDDIFGASTFDRQKSSKWLDFFPEMDRCIHGGRGNVRVIMTTRKYILNEVKPQINHNKYTLFREEKVVDLTTETMKLTEEEKRHILLKHLEKQGIQVIANPTIYDDNFILSRTVDQICSTKPVNSMHGFPHCVKLFTTNTHLHKRGPSFFANPMEVVISEINSIRGNHEHQYCVLLLLVLQDNTLDLEQLDDFNPPEGIVQIALKISGLSKDESLSKLRMAVKDLEGVYVDNKGDDTYAFSHESIYEAVAYSFGTTYPKQAVELAPWKFILERIRVEDYLKHDDELVIPLKSKYYQQLAERINSKFLTQDKQASPVFIMDVLSRQPLRNRRFRQVLFGCQLKMHPTDPLGNLPLQLIVQYGVPVMGFPDMAIELNNILLDWKEAGGTFQFQNHKGDNLLHSLCTCLHQLIGDKWIANVLHLLESDIEVANKNKDGDIPAMVLLRNRSWQWSVDTVKKLLPNAADVGVSNAKSQNILHCAAEGGHIDQMTYFLKETFPHLLATSTNSSELGLIARKYDEEVLYSRTEDNGQRKKASNFTGMSLNKQDINGNTPLMIALSEGNCSLGTCRILFENSSHVNLTNKLGENILHCACREGMSDDIAVFLLAKGVKIDQPNFKGDTPLFKMAQLGLMNQNIIKTIDDISAVSTVNVDFDSIPVDGETLLLKSVKGFCNSLFNVIRVACPNLLPTPLPEWFEDMENIKQGFNLRPSLPWYGDIRKLLRLETLETSMTENIEAVLDTTRLYEILRCLLSRSKNATAANKSALKILLTYGLVTPLLMEMFTKEEVLAELSEQHSFEYTLLDDVRKDPGTKQLFPKSLKSRKLAVLPKDHKSVAWAKNISDIFKKL